MLKVGTWNVNSINARLDRLKAVLDRHQPDVLCLQELKCTEDKFPYLEVKACGYEAQVFGQKAYNGVALLSREPLSGVAHSFEGCPSEDARYICADFRGIQIASAYIPNGQEVGSSRYFYKLDWLHKLGLALKQLRDAGKPALVLGDFNVAPTAQDVHDPAEWAGRILFSEPERAALSGILELGFIDVFRSLVTTGGQYSWWDYRQLAFPKNHGLRIDLILASQDLGPRFQKSYIDRDERKGSKPSDHAPVFAEFLE
ncbi:MAG: exodeoxyribonuclease III [Bdellovibrionota bacterium]